ncbi:FMN-dependent NADH-azoreductase [Mycoplasmoides pneumoniae]|uniref:FMN-dependent NADH-azoreductase n=1 Tax=Mycoplasmoides pneumoniae TaxID=2104 RepID=UPI003305D832
MKKVIIIDASVSPSGSYTHLLLERFLATFQAKNKDVELSTWNLHELPVGQISYNTQNAGTFFSVENSDKYIDALKAAHGVIILAPMTNFNYPATLKNFIDHVFVANKTFKDKYVTKGASSGMLGNLKVVVLGSQGAPLGWYPWGDHVNSLRGLFGFAGVASFASVIIDGTKLLYKDKSKSEVVDMFAKQVDAIANEF